MSPSRYRGAGKRRARQAGLGSRDPSALNVYGEELAEELLDKIEASMNNLKTEISSGVDPTFSYVYDHHRVALLKLNGVTLDMETIEWPESVANTSTSIVIPIEFSVSIRVHLAYIDGFLDSRDSMWLLQSIDNWLRAHNDLGDGFLITTTGPTEPRMAFDESATLGGQLILSVDKHQEYTQA